MDWSPEAFDRARREDKLLLVDSGAVWCHWCHVMDQRTYEDPEVAALLNERFVPVRVDRDRLPEVDAQLQRGVAVIFSEGSGWPLTAVLTPEGQMVFKATFVPPRADPQLGMRAGLLELLERIDSYWHNQRDQLEQEARRLGEQIAEQMGGLFSRPGAAEGGLVELIAAGLKQAYDSRHGGFGDAPKFYNAVSLELLLSRAWGGDGPAGEMAAQTLTAIAAGGVHDQLGGGFHRYSVDDHWAVPHFEKMAYDNAALLALYANAASLLGREDFAAVARCTLGWILDILADPDRRGFYASQDADAGPGDDGDYFTWTLKEVRQVLGEQSELAIQAYDLDTTGDVAGRGGRNVLRRGRAVSQMAQMLGLGESETAGRLEKLRQRLLAARRQRTIPAIDRTIFADLNGMMIDAHLTAWERLGEGAARQAALSVLDALLEDLRDDRGVLAHYRQDGRLVGIGRLADQAWMLRALLHAYAASLRRSYLDAAVTLADFILGNLTAASGAFISAEASEGGGPASPPPTVSWEDAPVRSAASVAAEALVQLGAITHQRRYGEAARRALESFAGGVSSQWATFLGGYGLAMESLLNGPRLVTVVGPADDPAAEDLAAAARRTCLPSGLAFWLDGSNDPAQLPPGLQHPPATRPAAYVCRNLACLEPASDPGQLARRLEQMKGK